MFKKCEKLLKTNLDEVIHGNVENPDRQNDGTNPSGT
jgi:hypothetical protein